MDNLQHDELLVDQTHENNEKDKLQQVREARRRKILENAKERLEKLNLRNRSTGETVTRGQGSCGHLADDYVEYSDPEVEPDIPHFPLQSTYNFNVNRSDASEEKISPVLKFKIHIILAALVAYVMMLLLRYSQGIHFSIFIPLGVVLLLDKQFFPKKTNNSSIIYLLMLFGIRSDAIKNCLDIIFAAQRIISNIAIYIFSFCLISLLGNSYIYLIEIK